MNLLTPTLKSPPRSALGRTLTKLFGIDLRSLALLRIAMGFAIICDLIDRSFGLRDHYTDEGVLPAQLLIETFSRSKMISIYYYVSHNPTLVAALFVLSGIFAALLMFGWRTRWMTVLCWYMLVSLHERNPSVTSGDVILKLLVFWSIFLPLGARWSLDARRAAVFRQASNQYASVASFALLMQICFIYWFTGLYKNHAIWWEGEAVYVALNFDLYAMPVGMWLREQHALLTPLTYASLALELIGPFLLFVPWKFNLFRSFAIIMFVTFHIGLAFTLNLGLFQLFAITAWIAFVPGCWWDALERRRHSDAAVDQWPTQQLRSPRWIMAISGFLIVYVFCWNLANLNGPYAPPLLRKFNLRAFMPDKARFLGEVLQLEQLWIMFAPHPPRSDGWFVVPGELADGTAVDLFKGGGDVTWDKPEIVSYEFESVRWRRFLTFHAPIYEFDPPSPRWEAYANFLCRDWNREHSPDKQVVKLTIYFMQEYTPRLSEPPNPIVKRTMIEYSCNDVASSSDEIVSDE